MKTLSLACVFTQLFLQIGGQTWYEFEGHCYTILGLRYNFDTSKATCLTYGSYPVELEEEPELAFVRTLIDSSNDQYWVGLRYINATQRYNWIRDGQEPTTSLWLPGEPNLSGQCARLATGNQVGTSNGDTYLLGDQYCSSSMKVICEKNADMMEIVNYRELVTSVDNKCPMVTYPARSKLQCARNCSKNKSCIGFQYQDANRACTPYRFSITCPTAQISPLTIYAMEYTRC